MILVNPVSIMKHISEPTRIGKTLIDQIYSNISSNIADVIPPDAISDHEVNYDILKYI